MHKKPNGARTAGIVILAALLVFGVLLAAFFSTSKSAERNTIVLPDPVTQPPQQLENPETEAFFLQVDNTNVQAVLKSLEQPEAYHQSLQLTQYWDGGSAVKTVERWRCGTLSRAQITAGGSSRQLLTNGADAWVWYDAEREAARFLLDGTRTWDDLVGVASFETTLALAPSQIEQAAFLPAGGELDVSCVYLKTTADEDGYSREFWVDVATQLLYRTEVTRGETVIYQLQQTAFEALPSEDSTLQALFVLPDGTAVTAEPETPQP